MTDYVPIDNSLFFRKYGKVFLAISFTIGILSGIVAAKHADSDLLSLLWSVPAHTASFPVLLIVSLTPLLASCLAVYIGRQWLIHIIAFFKSFSWSFCSYLILLSFRSAGWLVQFLMLFSGSCLLILLCWFSLRYISGSKHYLLRNWTITVFLAICVCCIDYCVISPYMVNLIAYLQ